MLRGKAVAILRLSALDGRPNQDSAVTRVVAVTADLEVNRPVETKGFELGDGDAPGVPSDDGLHHTITSECSDSFGGARQRVTVCLHLVLERSSRFAQGAVEGDEGRCRIDAVQLKASP